MNITLPHAAHRRAFTLIELLTVIAIIGILAAILIPVIGKVRQTARAATCASNMRQFAVGFSLFAEDHKGRMVYNTREPSRVNGPFSTSGTLRHNPDHWATHIRPYVTKQQARAGERPPDVMSCPSNPAVIEAGTNAHISHFARTNHLALTPPPPNTAPTRATAPLFPSRMSAPSRVIALVDAQISANNNETYAPHDLGSSRADRLSSRHGDRVNVMYFDWHIGTVSRAEMMALASTYVVDSGQLPWEDPAP